MARPEPLKTFFGSAAAKAAQKSRRITPGSVKRRNAVLDCAGGKVHSKRVCPKLEDYFIPAMHAVRHLGRTFFSVDSYGSLQFKYFSLKVRFGIFLFADWRR